MKIFTALIFTVIPFAALGQTACPNGVAPGSPQCGPDSGTSRGDIAPPPPRPNGEWIKTWGAIASSNNGDVGSSTGKLSEEDAKAEAIKICADFGNSDCQVNFTYKNQCVAVVQAAKGRTGGKIISAATKEIAQRSALQKCAEASGEKCVVRGTDCSDPFFRKY
ncbi:DUF4189 domain-containing protein [Xanthomonas axonopodis pv. vasculorum]|uniref:DUF4189 domain-containing protein n=1 Tax=Xanthomonas axonopodis TaxID=53413 RepID=UPI000D458FC7|nr:DUF4189 domain-containing protein [Xanthomonas axonopodis]PPV07252.1 hypothetical protein XavaCFBP5823_19020 [Xanthomonas axonopodis pv. vasculorum]QKD86631.1 DUF4189 domain-containing protein [Xanthomonas axonopodis pv. vasculorum]